MKGSPPRISNVGPLDARPGPAARLSPEGVRALAQGTLRRKAAYEARIRHRLRWGLAVAAALAAAGAYAAIRGIASPPPRGEPPAVVVPASPPENAAPLPLPTEPQPPPAPAASELPQAPLPPVPPAPSERRAPAFEKAPAESAEDLLRVANGLRSEGRWKEATRTYERVTALAPGSAAAYTARVASGSIRVEHLGDARGALSSFRAAMAEQPEGALSEEVQWGMAECYRALGDAPAEAAALRELVRRYPQSVMRGEAEKRLEALPHD